MTVKELAVILDTFFRANGRMDMPWRENTSPYYVLVSEIMLQQTQVERVKPKFIAFVQQFPDIKTLAQAELGDVLRSWSGLGYNRRAKFLWQATRVLHEKHNNAIPKELSQLVALPGIGKNTAGAVLAYAFDQPALFVETNIRTVFIHHFFPDQEAVTDAMIAEKLQELLDIFPSPRVLYWSLMDYGTYLKKTSGGRLHQSKHYKKQPPLAGSLREMRGKILKTLAKKSYGQDELRKLVSADERYDPAIRALLSEGFIVVTKHGELRLT